ncbi:MAG: hypothetical protein V5A72_03560, partial [Candidatus Nanohaloarchaea archaeon]
TENATIVTFPTELIGGMKSGESEASLRDVLDKVGDIDLSNFNVGDVAENLEDSDINLDRT